MASDESDVDAFDNKLQVSLRKRLSRPISSDEDEDEDGEMLDEDRQFINDDEDEDEEDEDLEGSKQADDVNEENNSESEALDDDDLDLLEENLGIRRKLKRRRVVMEKDDDEESVLEGKPADVSSVQCIGEADDDFIAFVIDEDQSSSCLATGKVTLPRSFKRYDAAMQDAHDIFGTGEEDLAPTDEENKSSQIVELVEQIYEPSELEQNLLTEFDTEVKLEDKPERFKLRRPYPVTFAEPAELEMESEWIYGALSRQIVDFRNRSSSVLLIKNIYKVLELIRNEFLEVPFIANYRKEYIFPNIKIEDLWKIWDLDEQWSQLNEQRNRLKKALEQTHSVQLQRALSSTDDNCLHNSLRPIDDSDIEWLMHASTTEDLNDISSHFRMYYGLDSEFEKSSQRRQPYCMFRHLIPFAKRIGLNAQNFVANVNSNFKKFEPDQYYLEPTALAQDFVNLKDLNGVLRPATSSISDVINAAVQVAAEELAADPRVRSSLRRMFFDHALIDVYPTDHGLLTICDGNEADQHPCRRLLFIRNKSVSKLADDEFLHLNVGKNQRLLTYKLYVSKDFEDHLRKFVIREEYTTLTGKWNELREKALNISLNKFMYPLFERELASKLLKEAEMFVISKCRARLSNLINYGTFKYVTCQYPMSHEDEQKRIIAIDYDGNTSSVILITAKGQIDKVEFVCLSGKGFQALIDVVNKYKSEFKIMSVLLAAEDMRCLHLQRLLNNKCTLCDMTVARVYQSTKRAEHEFRDQPALVRRAVSMYRYLRDPLLEICQLANIGMDLCDLPLHSLQTHIDKHFLYDHLCRELINKISQLGVDINRCIQEPYTSGVFQFVSGLGPRKANYLLKTIGRNGQLSNRSQLITLCKLGPRVFINCAGFIKIDPRRLSDDLEGSIEFLDSTRIHPEAYEWARKMAVDGLEYDDSAAALATSQPGNASAALEEIVETPERLKELDLDAFAAELSRTGYGNKSITLYDIRSELINRFNDIRPPFKVLSDIDLFYSILRESPETFNIGTHVNVQVVQVITRSPNSEDVENLNPIQNDDGSVHCPYCIEKINNQLDLWNHVETQCPGIPVGVRVSFECANQRLNGFVPIRLLSDDDSYSAAKLRRSEQLLCSVQKIDFNKMRCILSARKSDLAVSRDIFIDEYAEKQAINKSAKLSAQIRADRVNHGKEIRSYLPRVVVHPSFRNVDYQEAERLLSTEFEVGEALIRPSSSQGQNYLTLTFKVSSDPFIVRHYLVREEDKKHSFTIGKKLFIEDEEFEDLDEIMARFVAPMASFLKEIYAYKNFLTTGNDLAPDAIVQRLSIEKSKSNRIPYCLSVSRVYPGRILLSYMPTTEHVQEYISIRFSGLKFRNREFGSLVECLNWFKRNYREKHKSTSIADNKLIGENSVNCLNKYPVPPMRTQPPLQNMSSMPLSDNRQFSANSGITGGSFDPQLPSNFQPSTLSHNEIPAQQPNVNSFISVPHHQSVHPAVPQASPRLAAQTNNEMHRQFGSQSNIFGSHHQQQQQQNKQEHINSQNAYSETFPHDPSYHPQHASPMQYAPLPLQHHQFTGEKQHEYVDSSNQNDTSNRLWALAQQSNQQWDHLLGSGNESVEAGHDSHKHFNNYNTNRGGYYNKPQKSNAYGEDDTGFIHGRGSQRFDGGSGFRRSRGGERSRTTRMPHRGSRGRSSGDNDGFQSGRGTFKSDYNRCSPGRPHNRYQRRGSQNYGDARSSISRESFRGSGGNDFRRGSRTPIYSRENESRSINGTPRTITDLDEWDCTEVDYTHPPLTRENNREPSVINDSSLSSVIKVDSHPTQSNLSSNNNSSNLDGWSDVGGGGSVMPLNTKSKITNFSEIDEWDDTPSLRSVNDAKESAAGLDDWGDDPIVINHQQNPSSPLVTEVLVGQPRRISENNQSIADSLQPNCRDAPAIDNNKPALTNHYRDIDQCSIGIDYSQTQHSCSTSRVDNYEDSYPQYDENDHNLNYQNQFDYADGSSEWADSGIDDNYNQYRERGRFGRGVRRSFDGNFREGFRGDRGSRRGFSNNRRSGDNRFRRRGGTGGFRRGEGGKSRNSGDWNQRGNSMGRFRRGDGGYRQTGNEGGYRRRSDGGSFRRGDGIFRRGSSTPSLDREDSGSRQYEDSFAGSDSSPSLRRGGEGRGRRSGGSNRRGNDQPHSPFNNDQQQMQDYRKDQFNSSLQKVGEADDLDIWD
ncbi:hypothetical protein GJ496_000989 [Pomphorhynchus laevis]|nr:hypothetical protein GJ496_000989 [Pomphorhynchus laevis]